MGVAEALSRRVRDDLPTHDGLAAAASGVATAARKAEQVSRAMKSPLSLHRLPAVFGGLVVPGDLDLLALLLRLHAHGRAARSRRGGRTPASRRAPARRVSDGRSPRLREAVERVTSGQVDLAFVQGGLTIPAELPRLQTPSPEVVLWLVRNHLRPSDVKKVLTSLPDEGSHTVAKHFLEAWKLLEQVEFIHDWPRLTTDANYKIAADIDAVFVVKDPADEKTIAGISKLLAAGFELRSPLLGAGRAIGFCEGHDATARLSATGAAGAFGIARYVLREHLHRRPPPFNAAIARPSGSRSRCRAGTIAECEFNPTTADASEIFQGIEAFMGIIVNIGLAFLGLLGLDIMTYRKQFHELNSLISLLSMLQSNKDVLGLADGKRKTENLLYLSLVSDLLGIISTIASYYTQENSALLFNNLPEVIHQRCDGLKINIQLKILHATVTLPQMATP